MQHAMDALKPFTLFGELANTGSALNIRVYLRSSAANCFFQIYKLFAYPVARVTNATA
jgi:hypothetical protein